VALRGILDLPGGQKRTRSPAERRTLRLLRSRGFAGFETNAAIHGYEVDVLWRELDVAIEVDGFDAHAGRIAFERDRLKIATLKARGVDVMPMTGRQLREDPDGWKRGFAPRSASCAALTATERRIERAYDPQCFTRRSAGPSPSLPWPPTARRRRPASA
jgi:very-short-patch-repair endonuclease